MSINVSFTEGAIDTFEGESILHDCSIFDMKNSPADSILMTLNHEGKLISFNIILETQCYSLSAYKYIHVII